MPAQQLSFNDLLSNDDAPALCTEAQPSGRRSAPHSAPAPGGVSREGLSARDEQILAFEREWFANPGSKEAAITRRFDITPTRYFQILNGLLDDPQAMTAAPQVVARLRRVRARRQRSRRLYRAVARHGC